MEVRVFCRVSTFKSLDGTRLATEMQSEWKEDVMLAGLWSKEGLDGTLFRRT